MLFGAENSSPDTAASKRITRALKKNTHPNLGGTIPQNVLDDPNAEVGVEVAATSGENTTGNGCSQLPPHAVPSVVLRGALDEKRNEPLFNANALEKLAYVFAGSPLSALHGITNKCVCPTTPLPFSCSISLFCVDKPSRLVAQVSSPSNSSHY